MREAATTKLCLVGKPALPYLENALTSDDAEVRRRAEAIKTIITTAAEVRLKELVTKDLPHPVRPTFTFIPRAQVLDGSPVDVIQVHLSGPDAAAAAWMQQAFGPDWDKIRIAVHGKQLVVLVGSEEKLLQGALTNLKENRPGMAASKPLEWFARQAEPARKVETHISVQSMVAMMRRTT